MKVRAVTLVIHPAETGFVTGNIRYSRAHKFLTFYACTIMLVNIYPDGGEMGDIKRG